MPRSRPETAAARGSADDAAVGPGGSPPARPGSPATLRRLVRLARPEARLLVAGTVALALGSATGLLFPQAFRIVIDGAVGAGAPSLLGAGPEVVDRAAWAMAGLAVLTGAAIAARYYCFSLAGERAVARLRGDLYRAILAQEVAFFDARRTGELTSRLSSDTATLQAAVSSNVSMALRNLAQMLGAIGFLLFTSPSLTLVMLAVVPPVAVGGVAYGRRVRRLARDVQDALAAAGEIAEETISGLRTVRAFDAEEREVGRYRAAIARALQVARRRISAGAAFLAGAATGGYVAAALVLWYGGRLVARGGLTAGGLTSFLVYTLIVAMSAGALADLWADMMRAAGAAERIFEIQDRAPGIAPGGAVLQRVDGAIAWDGVHFSYPSRPDVPVLQGVDLAIAPGEVVAVVGPSGGGKSTLAALLSRFYDPDRGAVRLDGQDLRALDARWLRRQIGIVSQEPILFSGTVAENVRYGRPGASDADVEAALAAANALAFVRGFPEGVATRVGERGIQLSGGQKQRVAIARALLEDPRVLVLDEATSALDAESEHLVQEALERLMRGRTTLVIAHRLSTVVGADRVVVLQSGRVVQLGTHAALLAEDGPYRRLVERQFVAA